MSTLLRMFRAMRSLRRIGRMLPMVVIALVMGLSARTVGAQPTFSDAIAGWSGEDRTDEEFDRIMTEGFWTDDDDVAPLPQDGSDEEEDVYLGYVIPYFIGRDPAELDAYLDENYPNIPGLPSYQGSTTGSASFNKDVQYTGNDVRGWFSIAPLFQANAVLLDVGDEDPETRNRWGSWVGAGASLEARLHGGGRKMRVTDWKPAVGSFVIGADVLAGLGDSQGEVETAFRLGWSVALIRKDLAPYDQDQTIGYRSWGHIEGSIVSLRYNWQTGRLRLPLEFAGFFNYAVSQHCTLRFGGRIGMDIYEWDLKEGTSRLTSMCPTFGLMVGVMV